MNRKENEIKAKLIINFYKDQASRDKTLTASHFITQGFPKSTVYKIIKRYESTGRIEYCKIPGRKALIGTKKNVKRIVNAYKKNPSISVRNLSAKLKIPKSTLSRIKIKKAGIKARVKQVVPKYKEGQAERAKTGAAYVWEKSQHKHLIIDDETYVAKDPKDIPGRQYYHCVDPNDVEFENKTKRKTKFFEKFMVWQAIDELGNVSEPYISEGTINAEIYLEECIKKRLIPFIKKYHHVHNVLFWPDLATSHYAKIVTDHLNEQNIEFVPKKLNPPNLPQARPIEQFWAICKQKYAERDNPLNSLVGFKKVWLNIAKDVAIQHGVKLIEHGAKMLEKIAKNGVQ
jgi:hypothetical protein